MVVVTSLLAFAIVVALYTVPDILAGRSITGNGQPTTFFGGSGTAAGSGAVEVGITLVAARLGDSLGKSTR